jgi:hypothetical protein
MTNRTQILRSSSTTVLPAAGSRLAGELFVNLADLQLGVIDAVKNPQKLVAVRYFATTATYAAGDIVVQAGALYAAKASIPPGAFSAAQWTKIVAAGDAGSGFLPLAGGVLTGALFSDGPAGSTRVHYGTTSGVNRWILFLANNAAEGGSNAGSDFGLTAHNDAGAVIGTPLYIQRATGYSFFNGVGATMPGLAIPGALGNAIVSLNKAAATNANAINGFNNGVLRWQAALGNGTAEAGSNAGSDFTLAGFSDAGAGIGASLLIQRASGYAFFNGAAAAMPVLPSTVGNAVIALNKTAAGNSNALNAYTGGSPRWQVLPGNGAAESGSNAGSDFAFSAYADAGGALGTPFYVQRATGYAFVNASGAAMPSLSIPGTIGHCSFSLNHSSVAGTLNNILGYNNGSLRWSVTVGNGTAEGGSNAGSDFTINSSTDLGAGLATPLSIKRSTGVATFSAAIVNGPSDRTLKENIAPLEGALDKILALQGVSFNMIETPEKREIGLIAQDVEPVVPEIVQEFQTYEPAEDGHKAAEVKLALDYPKLVAVLIEAVKTLAARVETLEAVS